MLLTADTVLTGRELLRPGWIEVSGDAVRAVGAGPPPRRPDRDLGALTVVPGFVDTHVHGGGGANFSDGSRTGAAAAAELHLRHGTTTLVASLVTAAAPELLRQVKELANHVRSGVIAGIHLEGPWLAAERCGAHDPTLMRDPDPAELDRLLDAGDGAIRMITLAPEGQARSRRSGASSTPTSSPPSATPRQPTNRRARPSTPARRSRRTCSTPCAPSTTASPAR